ncbi:MAG: flagellar basal body L-ring protein FlgH [Deltaproteobacteria bacterium]|nr:flagellar basal body L-ring protein FlgH [Deltaproteobacteria bacterium]
MRNSKIVPLAVATLVLVTLSAACGPAHTGAYKQKKREYAPDAQSDKKNGALSEGSLWQEGRPASMLFTDARALHTNDLVVIKVEEIASANRSANTNLARDSAAAAKIDAFLGILGKLQAAGIDPAIGGSSKSSFKGEGKSDRSEFLTATVPALVRKVLPNGNLFVEGHRVVLVNSEEQHFYISGVVRPIDIDQENSVKSSMVADAEIEFVGAGDLTDNQKQSFMSRYFGWMWPW